MFTEETLVQQPTAKQLLLGYLAIVLFEENVDFDVIVGIPL